MEVYLEIMPNLKPDISLRETHILEVHSLCPVSNNPMHGSTITVSYVPKNWFLEVYSLQRYIDSFRGGKRIGLTFVRDMEQTIQVIKSECEEQLQVAVYVRADLLLDTGKMILELGDI